MWWWIGVSPKATNSVAGGNATGFGHHTFSDPERVEFTAIFDPFRVGSSFAQDPVALPPAIEYVAFGDRSLYESPIHPIGSGGGECYIGEKHDKY